MVLHLARERDGRAGGLDSCRVDEDGLPVGLQVMGPFLEDATSIDLAGAIGELMGGFRPPPGFD